MRRFTVTVLIFLLSAPLAAFGQPSPGIPTGFVVAEGADFASLRWGGGTSVKLLADWSALEPEPGQFAWKPLDEAIAAASSAGLQVVLVLAYTPKWASPAEGPDLADPAIYSREPAKRIDNWAAFVSAVASRYKGKVRDWQVWTALSLPLFRGTITEYLVLLRAARLKTKATDPTSRIVLATAYGVDLIAIRRALLEVPTAFDVISLAPRGLNPDELLRPLGVLRERLLAKQWKVIWIEWDLVSVGARPTWPGQVLKVMTIARVMRVEQVFWVGEGAARAGVFEVFARYIGLKPFVGYLVTQQALVFLFGAPPATAVAWSVDGDILVPLDADAPAVYTPTGEVQRPPAGGGKITVGVSADPVFITGIRGASVIEARTTLQGKGLPVPPTTEDFSQASEISARLGAKNLERGLYNMRYRSRQNGAVEVVQIDGSEAVRANAAKEIVFVYFHVDESFLYFIDGRATVEIVVEVRGARAPQQLGFNVLYDSMTGYRFTPWQWVETKDGWVTYTFRLTDANFANTWGWDFAINAAGNRNEDLTVRTVTVRKIPNP